MSFLGRLNYISRFIAQSTVICEPIFRMLKKDAATKWIDDCQKAFDRIKEYLSTPPVLVSLEPRRPLLLYLAVLDRAFGCVLGQYDEIGEKDQAIYYLSKKFTPYEARMLKKDAATKWIDDCQKAFDRIKEYLSTPPVLVSLEPRRPILLYLAVLDRAFGCVLGQYDEIGEKDQAIYYLSKKFTPYEARMLKKDIATKWIDDCQKAFDRIKEYLSTPSVLVSPEPGRPLLLYLAELRKRFTKTKFQHIPRVQNEFADALATLSSIIQHPNTNSIDPIPVKIHDQSAYCTHIEEEADGKPWFHDIKEYLTTREYPELTNAT
ncbi:uncharacterized protein [Nicotiana sylvestris]|uniref:uncharacterized protein n=1 Tax=Nicotiana sylvestris TaxID=4096 RepID=UPI00388CAE3F